MNSELTKKGYLIVDDRNFHKKSLHAELVALNNYYEQDDPLKIMAITFNNE